MVKACKVIHTFSPRIISVSECVSFADRNSPSKNNSLDIVKVVIIFFQFDIGERMLRMIFMQGWADKYKEILINSDARIASMKGYVDDNRHITKLLRMGMRYSSKDSKAKQ